MNSNFDKSNLLELVGFNANILCAHWRAGSASSNEHSVLGSLYSELGGYIDAFVEGTLGALGSRDLGGSTNLKIHSEPTTASSEALIAYGLKLVGGLESELDAKEDSGLMNILADMKNSLVKAKYLLEL